MVNYILLRRANAVGVVQRSGRWIRMQIYSLFSIIKVSHLQCHLSRLSSYAAISLQRFPRHCSCCVIGLPFRPLICPLPSHFQKPYLHLVCVEVRMNPALNLIVSIHLLTMSPTSSYLRTRLAVAASFEPTSSYDTCLGSSPQRTKHTILRSNVSSLGRHPKNDTAAPGSRDQGMLSSKNLHTKPHSSHEGLLRDNYPGEFVSTKPGALLTLCREAVIAEDRNMDGYAVDSLCNTWCHCRTSVL